MISHTLPQVFACPQGISDRHSILIVEDDADIAEFLIDSLQEQGFLTNHISNGEHVSDLIQREKPNLILMDVGLPGIDGMTLCDQLSDNPETMHIPIIILSGLEEGNMVRQSRACGARYFLKKPYDPNVLLMLIKNALVREAMW